MPQYEYRVIPAPDRGLKAKGFRTSEARFAHALETLMNDMGSRGWEYQRAETLPAVERSNLGTAATTLRNMLIFRRMIAQKSPLILKATERLPTPRSFLSLQQEPEDELPQVIREARKNAPTPNEPTATARNDADFTTPQTPNDDASQSEGAVRMLKDNGVEDFSDMSEMSSSLKQLAASRNLSKSDT